MTLFSTVRNAISDMLNAKENELIGGVLFTEDKNNQILLFNKFGVCTSNSLSLKSDITTHYTEENYWVNDHWAINPPQYTLSGYIGEVIYTRPDNWANKVESLFGATGLGLLTILSPKLGSYTSGVLNITRKVNSVVNKYTSIAKKAVKNAGDWLFDRVRKTNQRRVLDELESLMNNRTLCSVYTPYGVYNKFAIIAVNIRQAQNSKHISDIEVTFQKWRDVGDYWTDSNEEKFATDVAAAQKAKENKKGLVGTIKQNLAVKAKFMNQNDVGSFQVA